MSTKLWVDDVMYMVDEPIAEYVDKLKSENDKLKSELQVKLSIIRGLNQRLSDMGGQC